MGTLIMTVTSETRSGSGLLLSSRVLEQLGAPTLTPQGPVGSSPPACSRVREAQGRGSLLQKEKKKKKRHPRRKHLQRKLRGVSWSGRVRGRSLPAAPSFHQSPFPIRSPSAPKEKERLGVWALLSGQAGGHSRPSQRHAGAPGFRVGRGAARQPLGPGRREGTASPTPGLSRFPSASRDPTVALQSREREEVGPETCLLRASASRSCPHKACPRIYRETSG